jgi:hypothetical protein
LSIKSGTLHRPQAAPIGPPLRPSGRCDETGSVAFYTNTCRSHNVTEFSAPTRRYMSLEALAKSRIRIVTSEPAEPAGEPTVTTEQLTA